MPILAMRFLIAGIYGTVVDCCVRCSTRALAILTSRFGRVGKRRTTASTALSPMRFSARVPPAARSTISTATKRTPIEATLNTSLIRATGNMLAALAWRHRHPANAGNPIPPPSSLIKMFLRFALVPQRGNNWQRATELQPRWSDTFFADPAGRISKKASPVPSEPRVLQDSFESTTDSILPAPCRRTSPTARCPRTGGPAAARQGR